MNSPLIINGKNYDILLDNIRLIVYRKVAMREYLGIIRDEGLCIPKGATLHCNNRRFEDLFMCITGE